MPNDFKPNVGGKISKRDAEEWMKKYDKERKDKDKDTRSVFFGKEFLLEVLKTEEAAGISFFFVKKPSEFAKKDVLNLVLVPTKEDGTLIWPKITQGKDDPEDGAYDKGLSCPPTCS